MEVEAYKTRIIVQVLQSQERRLQRTAERKHPGKGDYDRCTVRFNPLGLGAVGIQYQYNYIIELLQQNKPPQNLIV